MTNHSAICGGCEVLVDALKTEFGAVLAARILEAEEVDFLWDGRVVERYLGQHFGFDDDAETELSRVAIVSVLDGEWHAAVCVVDGDGGAVSLLWNRCCNGQDEAQAVFNRAS